MIMEPLVYLLVTATTLTSHLAYLHQAMAMLHVVYASISILLDMGGAGLIRDLGGVISTCTCTFSISIRVLPSIN